MSNGPLLQCIDLLRGCKSLGHLKQVHAFASKTGLDADAHVAGQLILLSAVTFADALDYARSLLLHFPSPDAFMYNTIIRGFSESAQAHHSIPTFNQMRNDSVPPDSFSFAFLLKAAANSKSLCAGTQLHSLVVRHGLGAHLYVGTTLVSMYAECERAGSARKVFDEVPDRNVVTWNAVVTACFRSDDVEGAEAIFSAMPWRNLTSWNVMLAGYARAGELESARKLFLEMPHRDPVSWSTIIVGFASNGNFGTAFALFVDSLREGLGPNEVSLTGILSACAQVGAFEAGRILHCYIAKAGLTSIVAVVNALLDMYSRCGSVGMARLVFDREMGKKNVVSWTSMIASLAMHGFGEEAIRLFHEMEACGTKPDGITFISILYACSHAGFVQEGHRLFHVMKDAYGIHPSIEHYGCMVDLYGRAGLLDKAYELVSGMPIKPSAIIWRTLLGACSIHGNIALAELVKQQLTELDPNDSGDHVLLSNIYAVAGKWKDVAAVRQSMSERSIKKDPGWSSIEVGKVMYRFVVNDKLSIAGQEAIEKLLEVMARLRAEGYVPQVGTVLHDIEEEEKESAITRHSEKLAVAFGLARIDEGRTIRIVKNLRVCQDCHTVMKMISKVYGREIVVRDRSRFHCFREGHCSCRDYW